MSDEIRSEQQNQDDEMLAYNAKYLIPVLERRAQTALLKLERAYLSGEELRAPAGHFFVITDLIKDLESKLRNMQAKEK